MSRVLLVSNRFSPDYGGIETISLALAEGFVAAGMQVEVMTHSDGGPNPFSKYQVTRRPGLLRTWRSYVEADVVFHNNICLRFLWPALFVRRPLVFAVHNWLVDGSGRIGIRERIKRRIIGFCRSITVSRAVRDSLPFESTLVYNSYNSEAFHSNGAEERSRNSIAFVGRLVSGKGCAVLIDALAQLRNRGHEFQCSIVGDGQERVALAEAVESYGLQGSVLFTGALTAEAIGAKLRETEVLAVPSHCRESFGIVALEGIASGCFVIASDDGGLPEAVGECGKVVPQRAADQLADAIAAAWHSKSWATDRFRSARAVHLRGFSERSMIDGYLEVISTALKG
ncbi:glycosyltransferase family 4 protein [Arthrobacter methylotrophus]|uniref:Glycosyltransferase family 4 protein n=1 Tax=Arthrobacter methylotrophus TaxID=121291 RepID=A0ABV5USS2_9MICC